MRSVLAVLFVFFFFVISLPYMGIEFLLGKIHKPASDLRQLRFVQWGFRVVLFLSGVTVDVYGHENVPQDAPVLYVGNHRSIFDIVTTYALCPGLTGYISKDSVNKVPVLGMIMRRLYCLFIVRDDIKQSLKVFLSAIEYVKSGVSICIFPEGTRNRDREHPAALLPFKDGSFKIAQKSGCQIVPMAITGTADILENHFPWIKSAKVTITYGKPFAYADLSKEEQKQIGNYTASVISGMLEKSV